jgi:tetratricopeptide (TPR) repeat protein
VGQCERMATNRLDMLKQMLSENPNNTFARYGLAMELVKSGSFGEAITEFTALLVSDDSYAAAYFHGGQAYEKLGQVEEARRMYEKGIEVTTRKGDAHTRAELEAALSLLPV